MNAKFTSGQESQVGKIAKDAFTSLTPNKEDAQRLLTDPRLAPRLKALFTELMVQQPPCLVYAPELIPQGWEVAVIDGVVQDVAPKADLDVSKVDFKSFLQGDESYTSGNEMRKRAIKLKGNLGLSDAKRFLEQQDKIPPEFRGKKYIVFTGTVLRGSDGVFHVAYLDWDGGRWVLGFGWLGGGWSGDGLVACSE